MDERVSSTFANRDEAIPAINLQPTTHSLLSEDESGENGASKSKIGDAGEDIVGSHKRSHSLQDRLFAKYVNLYCDCSWNFSPASRY